MPKELTEEQKEAVRKAKREYKRKWREKNPGKDAEYMINYWLRKAGEIKEPQKEPDSLSKPGKVEGTSAPQPEVKEQKNTESLGDHEVKEPVTENTESPKEVTMESSQAEDASLKSA